VRVLIIGTGKIGCGHLAPLFEDAGWQVAVAARAEATAAAIRAAGRWHVQPGDAPARTCTPAAAVAVGSAAFAEEVAAADLVCAAVGVGNVASLAPPLAEALRHRDRPLDVWVVENADCAPGLRSALADRGVDLGRVGVAGVVTSATVGHGSWRDAAAARTPAPPTFRGDGLGGLHVDACALRTPAPALPDVELTPHYRARLDEKLFVFNAGHAVCAYLGALRGHTTVAGAARDPMLRPLLVGCLLEARRAVLDLHPQLGEDVRGAVADALARYDDAELGDPIARVARDPIRKLGAGDRLVGPARLIADRTGVVPAHFALAIAGALLYPCEQDAEARELRGRLARDGLLATLRAVSGLEPGDPLTTAVEQRYRGFIFTPEGTLFPPVHTTDALLAPRIEPVPDPVPPPAAARTPARRLPAPTRILARGAA
jgi:mannitol-1-phosphate 5-dehydrogenase